MDLRTSSQPPAECTIGLVKRKHGVAQALAGKACGRCPRRLTIHVECRMTTTGGSGALGNEQERKNEQCDHVHTPVCCTPVEAAAAPSLDQVHLGRRLRWFHRFHIHCHQRGGPVGPPLIAGRRVGHALPAQHRGIMRHHLASDVGQKFAAVASRPAAVTSRNRPALLLWTT